MSTDGRLDLDDLGEVIEHASSLDEVSSGAEDARPTLGERFAATGVPGWIRRHRAPIAGVTAVVVAVSAFLWFRRDTRPPDDGLAHVAVLDSLSPSGVEQPGPGLLSGLYTLVRQRDGDTVELLGIAGPGVRATAVGASVTTADDPARVSVPVLATLDCLDPRALTATEDQYRLIVRRTDAYGRTVQRQVPLPVGSQYRWSLTVGGTCLQTLTSSGISVESVKATPSQDPPTVVLQVRLRSSLDRDIAIDVLSYAGGQAVRPEQGTVVVPAGRQAMLRVVERVVDCGSPHLDGVIMSADGQTGYGVTDRTLDAYARVVTDSPDASSAAMSLPWSEAEGKRVTAAFATACAGLPAHSTRVVSATLAPRAAQADMLLRTGDPSARLVRTVIDIRTPASAVTVADMLDASELGGGVPTIVVIDTATGRPVRTGVAPASVRTSGGTARVTVDWMLTCSGAYSPPSARLQLLRDGRSWPLLLPLDEPLLAKAVVRACPEVTLQQLSEQGWASLQTPTG